MLMPFRTPSTWIPQLIIGSIPCLSAQKHPSISYSSRLHSSEWLESQGRCPRTVDPDSSPVTRLHLVSRIHRLKHSGTLIQYALAIILVFIFLCGCQICGDKKVLFFEETTAGLLLQYKTKPVITWAKRVTRFDLIVRVPCDALALASLLTRWRFCLTVHPVFSADRALARLYSVLYFNVVFLCREGLS